MKNPFKILFGKGASAASLTLGFAHRKNAAKTNETPQVVGRQICFFAAFFLPVSKMLEAPSLLAKYAAGDLLVPTLLHYLLQGGALAAILFLLSRLKKPLLSVVADGIGAGLTKFFCLLYAAYFLLSALIPLLDLEKFIYAAFYDTAPTNFNFTPFFFLCGFFCVKKMKALARCADLSLFLFLLPFLALILMSVGQTDVSAVLPIFGEPFRGVWKGFLKTVPHFADAALFLPLFSSYRYEKKDGKKIMLSYAVGMAFTLVFLVVFFGIFSTIAGSEHYAFFKIAQFFPALGTLGRIDLIFIYFLTALLFFNACLPVFYAVELFGVGANTTRRVLPAIILNVALFFFVYYGNSRYNAIYTAIQAVYPVFWVFSLALPLCLLFLLLNKNKRNRYALNKKTKRKKEKNYA